MQMTTFQIFPNMLLLSKVKDLTTSNNGINDDITKIIPMHIPAKKAI